MENKTKPAAFLLINTDLDARKVLKSVKRVEAVKWANNIFGPYQVVAYLETENRAELLEAIEDLRSRRFITKLDARMVKAIPGDDKLKDLIVKKPQVAFLLINVDYTKEKERNVTYNLRKLDGVVYARAMWGPTDIMVVVEADNHEDMRNLICDDVKTMNGVKTNSTLYCYTD